MAASGRRGKLLNFMSDDLRHTFKASNGDVLDDLLLRQAEANNRFMKATQIAQDKREELIPLEEEASRAWNEQHNIRCRLNEWWHQFRAAKENGVGS